MIARAALLGVATIAACGGSDGPSGPGASRLVIDGRFERNGTITVAAWQGTDSVPGAQLQIAVQPADAATSLGDGKLQLLRTGPLTITATLPDGRDVSEQRTVTPPPSIVLDLVVAGNRDVYRVALDGEELVRLTTNPGHDSHATVADGKVVFASYRDGQGELYEMPLAGGAERRLTTTAASETEPALSPDGLRLAFVRPVRGVTRVWVAAADATGERRLTIDEAASAASPESAPSVGSGGKIAFTTTARGSADIATVTTDVLPATPDVSAASSASADVEPAWNADGTRFVFISTRQTSPALYVAEASGASPLRIEAGAVSVAQPAWLADGRIVFVSHRASGAVLAWIDPAAPSEVHEIPLTGTDPAHPAPVR